jgi:type I restriction enzyme, S subunit
VGSLPSSPIPKVPPEWDTVALAEVCRVENGCPFESAYFNEKGEGVPVVRVRDVNAGTSQTYYSGPYDAKYLIKDGDLLVGMDGEFHTRKWTAGTALLNQRVCRLVPDAKKCHDDFLSFAVRAPLRHIEDHTPYTTVKHISARQILSIPLPYPPLAEQKQIAAVLSAVQGAIERQERLIALTVELKKSLMHKLFTEGTRGEPLKQTEMGQMPDSWTVEPLGAHLLLAQYGLSVRGDEHGAIPMLRMTNQVDGRIVPNDLQYVTVNQADRLKFRVEPGDILFNRTNSFELVGRTAIFELDGEFVFASYLIRMRTQQHTLRPEFLNHYFNWGAVQARLKSIASRAVSQSNISASRLRGFVVPLPAVQEQDEIIECIDHVDRTRTLHQRERETLQDLFRTLLHQLMTAQIRVNDLDLSQLQAVARAPVGAT